jgi:hypothetical protein
MLPWLYQARKLGGRRSVVSSCTRSSRGVAARPVSNLVSIGDPGAICSRTPPALRCSATTDRPAGHGKADPSRDPCMPYTDLRPDHGRYGC